MKPANKPDPKELILDEAEKLFAQSGIDAVSSRQLARAAGQRNSGAVQYHFGGIDGVVDAILAKHAVDVDSARGVLLDRLEADDGAQLSDYAAALVEPLGAKLSDVSGRAYLAVAAEIVNRPSTSEVVRIAPTSGSSLGRWRRMILPLLPKGAVELHSRFNAIQFTHTELARRARRSSSRRSQMLIISRMSDTVASILATELTDRTASLLESGRGDSEPLED